MNAKEAIKKIMAEKGVKTTELSRLMGVSVQNIWNTLNYDYSKSMTVEKLAALAEKMNYKVMLVPYESKVQGVQVND